MDDKKIALYPLTPDRWADFETLFIPDPTCRSCWCMWWRLKRTEFLKNGAEGNRVAMQALVASGEIPGLLAYLDDIPVGWVSVGPREAFPTLNRSPRLKPVDETRVWAIVCFAIARPYRRRGLSAILLRGAVDYALSQHAIVIEGYPVRSIQGEKDFSAFTGTLSTFLRAGFRVVADRGGRRVVVRR
ncbi:MAG: GNAT family N-acetyltransferase [Chloroflexi bacterium]|nr:GNAT family N-acetyltransferase [Chloroflexota bacterium]